ncbi:FeoB-associated Cys-rich membrane protein [Pontibacter mangrovi]|uniref:FeoB-associated Cys-rich membrane protein n=1 Tax=Pontibacter mangrovi TaxID=2589816 RepID=A0A501WAK6_9BACT|nr:FeoB-associated Cys-rich membrane protein [Pontibacter mangrovi]TPE45525.1 FeoB-associated Cys-rich membrane protein [Pontibacter mangrovi]
MIQHILILFIFLAAVAYMLRILYQTFTAKSGCAKSCGGCSTIDLKKIQQELEKRKASTPSV